VKEERKALNKLIKLTIALLCCGAGAVLAETATEPGQPAAERGLEEMLVTATRRAENISDVSQTVQALLGEDLMDMSVTNIEEMISLIPSATYSSTIGAGSTVFQIRGVAASETDGDATIGYYLDNFAFSMPGRPYAPVAEFYDVERVEVLRGPSGTLYGLGSLGGTIKVLTKNPNLDETEASFRLTGSTTKGGEENWSGDVMVNLPLVDGKVALRGVLSFEEFGGYADIIPSNEKNGNPSESLTGRLKLLAQPTDELSIQLTYWRQDSDQDYSNRITFFDPPSVDQVFGEILSDFNLYVADIEYDLGFATLQSTTGYIENTVISNNGGFIPGIGNFSSLWPLESENFNEDLRLTSNGDGAFNWIVGFFYQDGETFGGQDVLLPDFGFNSINNSNKLSSEAWAVYGEGSFSTMDDRLVITVGGRFYKEKRRFDEDSVVELLPAITGAPDPIVIPTVGTDRATNDTFNPRFNVAFHPNDDGMIYAEVAKGFRSGAITSTAIITASNAILQTDPPLDNSSPPDTLWSYTLGLKWSLFEGALDVDIAGYYLDWADAQIEISPALQSIVVPIADNEGKGVDLALTWNTPIDGLQLQFAGNISEVELDNVDPGITNTLPHFTDGAQLPLTAKRTFSVRGSYERPLGSSGLMLRTNALYSYRSKQQSMFDGRWAPSVGQLSARIGVGDDRWEVALYGRNLTDEIGPLARPGGQEAIPFPLTVGLSLEMNL
jgi:outer membrane receptor protein involved in Fe transport